MVGVWVVCVSNRPADILHAPGVGIAIDVRGSRLYDDWGLGA